MEDIRIYDFSFRLLHIEHNIQSAYWIHKYNGIGTFEGTFRLSGALAQVLFTNRYLFLTQGDQQAIITGKVADTQIKIYGKTPNWILSRRTLAPFKTDETTGENYDDVVQYALKTGFSDIFDTDFTYENLSGVENHSRHFWRNVRNPVSEVVRERLDEVGLGHRVVLDFQEKKWKFQIYQGEKRAEILSEENRNLKEVSLKEDLQDFYTGGYYQKSMLDKGEWNPNTGLPENNPACYGNYYLITYQSGETQNAQYPKGDYLVCDDSETGSFHVYEEIPQLSTYLPGEETGIYRWDASLSATTQSEAESALQRKKNVRDVAGKSTKAFENAKFSLGDIVRVQVTKGDYAYTVLKRVVGVERWTENGNIGEKYTFKEEENGI